ncbi:aminopeptidase P family protein [Methanoculleus sp. FWC-SCC1]|uniref:Aminopeptidase P family protein n=1 Tax=Methanoculleus frigidifontis TaxID=2584085 RepID=A0ABT8MBL2_9EURY|nr:Xaa-Pro peptidase family protein [Methanoculleus sp. FWC-SCC1]MDN7025332.1 aminopeptidase P family protein [Methanoculleus sp. FWC-SCC1]
MQGKVPRLELTGRLDRFRAGMDAEQPGWELAALFGKVNLFYFTGTMQDGVLLIPRSDEAVFWVRRSYERALDESLFPEIRPMRSYRDAAAASGRCPDAVHLETELLPLAHLRRFQKHFPFTEAGSLDRTVARVREVKSAYELSLMEQAGRIHRRVLEERAPALLREGMTELAFVTELYTVLIEEGHHGIVRFGMFDTEIAVGQIGFGESSIYPTAFDGPGGNYGMSPAVPLLGSRERLLKAGDLVFADIGCGVAGYHTDKTMTYMFGRSIPDEAIEQHEVCVAIQDEMASLLRPGIAPSEIYDTIIEGQSPEFLKGFMGFGDRQVKFLGHGVGLLVDETPVIARGFDEPLLEGMTIALEPKKGIAGVGMVGIENTFLVTPGGGRCITGDHRGLMPVW